jgi:hypothetical protein
VQLEAALAVRTEEAALAVGPEEAALAVGPEEFADHTRPGTSTRSRTAALSEVPLEVPEVVSVEDIPFPFTDKADESWSADKAVDVLDQSNVEKLLASSVKLSTAAKYGQIWDKWAAFAALHEVEIMPPDVRALEIFIADSAEFSGSSGVALTAAAAISHFSALQRFGSPCEFPRFNKMLRGIRLTHGKAAKPKEPFTPGHIITFMNLARKGTLREWRAALPLALCFQQLLRGVECFNLNGSNVFHRKDFFPVTVETSKNHPKGFTFRVKVEDGRPSCVGVFMSNFI